MFCNYTLEKATFRSELDCIRVQEDLAILEDQFLWDPITSMQYYMKGFV